MTLDNFRTIELIWDKANKSIIKTIKTASSDTTGRYFSVKVLDGGQEVTLNNAKLQLYWEHPNFNTSGTDDFNTVNNGGLFKMTFSNEMLTNIGKLTAHLVLNLPDGKITSDGFTIEVIKGADDGVVVPANKDGLVKQIGDLDERIDDVLADMQNISVSQINKNLGKIDQTYLDDELIAQIAGDAAVNAVPADGSLTTEKFAPKAVTPEKIDGSKEAPGLNRLNPQELIPNKSINTSGVVVSTTFYHLYYQDVNAGEVWTFNRARGDFVVFLKNAGSMVSRLSAGTDVPVVFTVPAGATRMAINIYNDYIPTAMLSTGDNTDTPFEPFEFGYNLDWLRVDKSNIINDVEDEVQSQWAGKKLTTFGDSITWYDGKKFASTHKEAGQDAVGYQTYLRNELGVVIDNQGVSGNNMTQIATIIKGYNLNDTDAITITSGANDWSQEKTIGTLQQPMSVFNESTFYGALQSSIESVLSREPHIKIVLITPVRGYHPTSTHTGEWLTKGNLVDGMLEQPDDYANAIKAVAELYGLEALDFRNETGMNFFNYEDYLRDNPARTSGKYVHPGNQYYEVMGKYAVERFKNIAI